MKLKIIAGSAVTVLIGAMAGCSGDQPTAAPTVSTSASPSPTVAAARPSATAVPVKALRLTQDDLGKRWQMSSSFDDRPAAECNKTGLPGQLNSDQVSYGTFVERKGAHPAQLGVGVIALPATDDATLASAVRAEVEACDGKSRYGWYLTSSFDDARTVAGADQVLVAYRQTAYVDKTHTSLLYVRQGLLLRSGPAVVDIENAFVPAPADRAGKSFAATEAIASRQLAKLSTGAGQ